MLEWEELYGKVRFSAAQSFYNVSLDGLNGEFFASISFNLYTETVREITIRKRRKEA